MPYASESSYRKNRSERGPGFFRGIIGYRVTHNPNVHRRPRGITSVARRNARSGREGARARAERNQDSPGRGERAIRISSVSHGALRKLGFQPRRTRRIYFNIASHGGRADGGATSVGSIFGENFRKSRAVNRSSTPSEKRSREEPRNRDRGSRFVELSLETRGS